MDNDEFEDYLVVYNKAVLTVVCECQSLEEAKRYAKNQQKHFEGVKLFVVKRVHRLEEVE